MTTYRFFTDANGIPYVKGETFESTHANNFVTALKAYDRAIELAQAFTWRTDSSTEADANVMAVAYNTTTKKYLFAGTSSADAPKAWIGATIREALTTDADSDIGTTPTVLIPYCALAAGAGTVQYLIGGDPGADSAYKLRTSPNGSTWTQRATSQAGTTLVRALSYDSTNGLYIAGLSAGATNVIETSPSNDGATWTARTSSMAGGVHSIATNAAGMSLAASAGNDDDYLYSTNGTTWTAATLPWTATEKFVCYSEAALKWFAIGSGAKCASSANGTTWTDLSAGMTGDTVEYHDGLVTTGAVVYMMTYKSGATGNLFVSWDDCVSWEWIYPLSVTSATRGCLANLNNQIVGVEGSVHVYRTPRIVI